MASSFGRAGRALSVTDPALLEQLATIQIEMGPAAIRTENALLTTYVFVDIRDRDIGSYVSEAQQVVRENIKSPPPDIM